MTSSHNSAMTYKTSDQEIKFWEWLSSKLPWATVYWLCLALAITRKAASRHSQLILWQEGQFPGTWELVMWNLKYKLLYLCVSSLPCQRIVWEHWLRSSHREGCGDDLLNIVEVHNGHQWYYPGKRLRWLHPIVKTIEEGRMKRHTHTGRTPAGVATHEGSSRLSLEGLFSELTHKYSNLYLIALLVPMV